MSDPAEQDYLDVHPDGGVSQIVTVPDDNPVAILKRQLAEMEGRLAALVEEIEEKTGANITEPPASAVMFGVLVETLFGDENDPQRITFDMRLTAQRLKALESMDVPSIKANLAAQQRRQARKGRRGPR